MLMSEVQTKTRILVVEDDVHLLSGIRDILELEEYDVITARDGKDGLRMLAENPDNPPDVIVSDIMMPHLDGFGLLEEVRKQDRWISVPFIFLTAKGEKHDRHRGSMLGADVYLTKPFDAEDLLVAVDSSLARHRNIKRVAQGEVDGVKRKVLTILNHEFRTPLTLVVAYAEMLKEYDPETMEIEDVMTFLQGVNSGADRLRRLVENFILMVEMDSGDAEKTFSWRKRPVHHVIDLCADACNQVQWQEKRPREYALDVPDDLPPVVLDSQFVTIALREMLDNATKFSNDGDRIVLSVRAVDDHMEFIVTDPGRGVPHDQQEKIWEPFYQINREEFEDQGGGSGLAIVDGVIRIHHGSRELISAPDQGSSFIMRLPLQQE